ncbi:MAG TPA: hypothetical protein VGI64_04690 [Streptosporangiaceae bacterium]
MDLAHADVVLGSPLGRQLLVRYLGFGSERSVLEELGLAASSGSSVLRAVSQRPRRLQRPRRRRSREWHQVPTDEARAVIAAAVARGEWRELSDRAELDLLTDLAETSFGFGFGGDEAIWALTALAKQELRPVAEALVAARGAAKWWASVALADQRFLEWDGSPRATGPAAEQVVRDGMRDERAENQQGLLRRRPQERAGTRIGAIWWSAPDFAQLTWTTSPAGDIPAIALGHFIDTLWPFEETGVTIWSLQIAPDANVLEITEPAGWQALVARFPRDVTGTHDGEWRYWGGVPGPWLLPDWEQVMAHYDGVHVTIGGYLASCGLALPVADGYTMLAGWIPGATLWLRDMAAAARPLGQWHGQPQDLNWDEFRSGWLKQ